MAEIRPFHTIGPGEMLKDELEYLGWSQEDFAQITGLSLKAVNELLNDKTSLTVETAKLIGNALGTDPQLWLNLDSAYRLRLNEDSERTVEAELYGAVMKVMPVREMVKKGWLPPFDSAHDLVDHAKAFWEVKEADFAFLEKEAEPCFRRSCGREYYEKFYALSWLRKAELSARGYHLPPFDQEKAEAIGAALASLTVRENGPVDFIGLLAEAGIGFFVLRHLQKTYLDGAAIFVDANPFIVYTGRYDRIDNFWFTVAHELAHVVLSHVKKSGDGILDELKDEAETEKERAADEAAAEYLRSRQILSFCEPYRQYLSRERVLRCAQEVGVHPGIVVGCLQRAGLLSYKNLNILKPKVMEAIPASRLAG